MRSIVLSKIAQPARVADALGALLPGQSDPWLLLTTDGDPIAYFHMEPGGVVQADISGRHYNNDAAVSTILEQLQATVGGEICCDP